ncbi:hypothetical protein [Bacillus cereus]
MSEAWTLFWYDGYFTQEPNGTVFVLYFSPHRPLYQVIKELHIASKKVMHIIKKRQTLQDEKFVQNRDPFGSTL